MLSEIEQLVPISGYFFIVTKNFFKKDIYFKTTKKSVMFVSEKCLGMYNFDKKY